ncbi:MAG TPA: nuclear transport factor 2 family protein [Parvibaculum sp.]|uniref:nuclear transport factor 2 family protein n=1 Tax=Parvibaculum sp. TaxID=2024848 RepID=UPI002C98ECBC|nr:nuclear transport factor 2 family protein [Parvibaculum sp.]HMM14875.1 nuclear transport factor 2 family protein [Parvibaculum sp.]
MAGDEAEVLALAERFTHAIEEGDMEGVRACYAPDAAIWHNFDNADQTVEENLRVLRWLARALPQRKYNIVRRVVIPGGYLQQHVLSGRRPNGEAFSMPACLVVQVADGRITRLEEYLDPAQAAVLAA